MVGTSRVLRERTGFGARTEISFDGAGATEECLLCSSAIQALERDSNSNVLMDEESTAVRAMLAT